MGEIDGWENIYRDILKEISEEFYSHDDFIQLQLVCKQWSLKLAEISNEILWLLIPEESSGTHIYEDDEIYHLMQLPIADEVPLQIQGLEENGIHYIKLPEMQNNLIRGSYQGWLIVVDIYEGSIYMLNAFTRVRLDLLPVSTFPNVIDYNPNNYGLEYTMRSFEDLDGTYTLSGVCANQIFVWKVIINSCPSNDNEDFMAVVIYGCECRLAYYKLNNKRWLDFPTNKERPLFQDVIFFEEKIYALDEYGQLYEFDTNTTMGGIHEAKPPSDVAVGSYKVKSLVGCDNGSLLMLVRYFTSKALRTYKFDIYELKKNAKEWSRINSLGNTVLIIGLNSSIQILPSSIQSKGNQIYFTDNYVELKAIDKAQTQDIGIFDLDDGSFQTILPDLKSFCPPVWCYSSSFL